MTLEFLKPHKTADGRTYVVGQLAEIADAGAQELIRQGIAKERTGTGEKRGDALEGGEGGQKPKR